MLQTIINNHRNQFFPVLTAVVSLFALSPDSGIYLIIALVAILLIYIPFLIRIDEPYRKSKLILLIGFTSLGSAFSRLGASHDALSSAGSSFTALLAISTVLASLGIGAVVICTRLATRLASPWSRLALFPAVWATLWCTVAYINPVGYLATWSPADNADAYNWLAPYLGPIGKDWIIAAWAVVISQTVTQWFLNKSNGEHMPLLQFSSTLIPQFTHSNEKATWVLSLFLVILLGPSMLMQQLPIPISDVDGVTPLTVGCVLPSFDRRHKHVLDLDDYIAESTLISSQARVILWPEGAVTFKSVQEREAAFKKIRTNLTGTYVGVSFIETTADPNDPRGKRSVSRTGLAVVSQYTNETQHILYYKRHLVPFVESFPLRHSMTSPSLLQAEIRSPRYIPKPKWGPAPNFTRPVLITSSICLDFATPLPFGELEFKPNLILAPARTWDPVVGNAMWLQAKQRAAELDSTILWCDGGEGGVSGIAGSGFTEPTQVGAGTFMRTFGIPYQYPVLQKSRPTFYARFGGVGLLFIWILVIRDPRRGLQIILRRLNDWRNHRENEGAPPGNDLLF